MFNQTNDSKCAYWRLAVRCNTNLKMKRIENLYDVTQRLCGMIEPQGESNVDEVRFENLTDTIDLTEKLIDDIISVARHKDRAEASIKKAGQKADDFISGLRGRLNPEPMFSETEIQRLQSKVHAITGNGEVMMLFNEMLGISQGSF
jgi:hypothetical protein